MFKRGVSESETNPFQAVKAAQLKPLKERPISENLEFAKVAANLNSHVRECDYG
jgi:hypothetical protein